MILPKVRDPRFIRLRRGGTLNRLKEEAEQRSDRTAQVERELEGDEEITGRP
jgi:hypothetical protein